MKTGLVIYAASVHHLAGFYAHVLELEVKEMETDYALLADDDFELVLLATEVSRSIAKTYVAREATPIKPVFFVGASLEVLKDRVAAKGGALYQTKVWEFGGRQVCDGHDCEGNIFQLRIRKNV
ncbi:MAG: hypothetical protein VX148_05795 [Pseudomonadota bacterium]|nr:hypothetical protein [Pseudomonadota bacterium]